MRGCDRLLIIAGSDSGGGAGIQADLKTASALGVFATTAITAVTAQNTLGVSGVQPVEPQMVRDQITCVLDDIGADAIKIGMLGSDAVVHAVADALQDYPGPIVLDPVMLAKSGDVLLDDSAVAIMIQRLLPRTALLTPNLPEAAYLLRAPFARDARTTCDQGEALRAMGAKAVLMKGGHAGGSDCTDWLISDDAPLACSSPRIETRNTHGTGCSLSSAIAAELAKGAPLAEAVDRAHRWLHGAIRQADQLGIGGGHGPVHHFHGIWT
ncbi:bifunctional hydroxymethylpyrimidine kinase/phosphomethylpyrimidine kinase [Paracoccus sp. Z330]|uniref:hydroxymethylpyrimidine kinase n=1 Tax=Paracoccus onchidii TaxID=3017813 RepID=A0ABT4ZJD1_9RHOB|nr:bifunctional hydroxymethylpyrimidine kinase/phosphomethylpyrimidine kinase [Paracoccus onchidii]MDB6179473.1 bifunctional hydroxymethylpyrimidine kinase/phosphomethylpyrimidine kinase [Paracoccus onchidii]